MDGLERTWRQVPSKGTIEHFGRGLLDFDFSIGGKTAWIPAYSYFRIGMKLEIVTAGSAPTDPKVRKAPEQKDGVAFANMAAGNLFDNTVFYVGGVDVSGCTSYAPQCHAVENRLTRSGAWSNSIGKDVYGINSNFHSRLQSICKDPKHVDLPVLPNIDEGHSSDIYVNYQPPIGISKHATPMGSGQYRYQFNPNLNYKTACVEQLTGSGAVFDFSVTSIELYICTVKMDIPSTGVEHLELIEHRAHAVKMPTRDGSFDFTVPSSTKSLSFFVQSSTAGTDGIIPPSRFACLGGQEKLLRSIQVSYANITKPPTRWSSEYGVIGTANEAVNKLQQRYADLLLESGQMFSEGGAESYSQWLMSPLIHYSWLRDSADQSSQVQLQVDYGSMEANANLFIIAHYSRKIDITVTNGFVSSVNALSV